MVLRDRRTLAPMDPGDYQSRLKWAMGRVSMDVPALAKALGVSYQAVKKATEGGTKMLAADNHMRTAQLLRVDALWLATGEGTYRGQGPLTAELQAALAKADPAAIRRAENAARAALDMDPLPRSETALAA